MLLDSQVVVAQAKESIRVEIEGAVSEDSKPQSKRAIIIGGGLGGLSAAIRLAKNGFAVHLFEAGSELG